MLFNSYPFIFEFMPVALAAFFLAALVSRRLAVVTLLLASLFFYAGWGGIPWLIIVSFTFNYLAARSITWAQVNSAPRRKTWILAGAIAVDLALLFYFKYENFATASLYPLLGFHPAVSNIVLPIGISFFTFTQIAFLVDVARDDVVQRDFLKYGLFVTYFPHLLAGPIIHHKEVMPQFGKDSFYRPSAQHLAIGMTIFTMGLFKKVVLADSFIPAADLLFGSPHAPLLFESWRGTLAYTLQIYFDFSGYSDMAIGLSQLFGIALPINFNSPYKATSIIDFWRRWHITLSRFLRDYLYIPLGGNRKGEPRRYANLFITMLLGGIWHGAGWTYVIWGALHGTYLVINHLWRGMRGERQSSRLERFAGWVITFAAVMLAWVFFRAPTVQAALLIVKGLAGLNNSAATGGFFAEDISLGGFALLGAGLFIAVALPNSQELLQKFHPGLQPPGYKGGYKGLLMVQRLSPRLGVAVGAVLFLTLTRMSHVTEFIYYQF